MAIEWSQIQLLFIEARSTVEALHAFNCNSYLLLYRYNSYSLLYYGFPFHKTGHQSLFIFWLHTGPSWHSISCTFHSNTRQGHLLLATPHECWYNICPPFHSTACQLDCCKGHKKSFYYRRISTTGGSIIALFNCISWFPGPSHTGHNGDLGHPGRIWSAGPLVCWSHWARVGKKTEILKKKR